MNETREKLISLMIKKNLPADFARQIADNLKTEKAMKRMIGYLHASEKVTAEDAADEMIAIIEENNRWKQKKEAEYYNARYTAWLNRK